MSAQVFLALIYQDIMRKEESLAKFALKVLVQISLSRISDLTKLPPKYDFLRGQNEHSEHYGRECIKQVERRRGGETQLGDGGA